MLICFLLRYHTKRIWPIYKFGFNCFSSFIFQKMEKKKWIKTKWFLPARLENQYSTVCNECGLNNAFEILLKRKIFARMRGIYKKIYYTVNWCGVQNTIGTFWKNKIDKDNHTPFEHYVGMKTKQNIRQKKEEKNNWNWRKEIKWKNKRSEQFEAAIDHVCIGRKQTFHA